MARVVTAGTVDIRRVVINNLQAAPRHGGDDRSNLGSNVLRGFGFLRPASLLKTGPFALRRLASWDKKINC